MNACNYSLHTHGGPITAREIIAALDPSDPVQAAHIGEIWTLCKTGMRYANQDGDILGAALASLHTAKRPPADHERGWVYRWGNCPAHIADARRWATA